MIFAARICAQEGHVERYCNRVDLKPTIRRTSEAAMDRIPFQATSAGALYDGIAALPVAVVLDNCLLYTSDAADE